MLTIELDSVTKWRNSREWRDVQRARCDGEEVIGDHRIIEALARRLATRHPDDTPVEVRRGDTRVFYPVSLGVWASGRVGKGEQPDALKSARFHRAKSKQEA